LRHADRPRPVLRPSWGFLRHRGDGGAAGERPLPVRDGQRRDGALRCPLQSGGRPRAGAGDRAAGARGGVRVERGAVGAALRGRGAARRRCLRQAVSGEHVPSLLASRALFHADEHRPLRHPRLSDRQVRHLRGARSETPGQPRPRRGFICSARRYSGLWPPISSRWSPGRSPLSTT
jgi:hypothetical protein